MDLGVATAAMDRSVPHPELHGDEIFLSNIKQSDLYLLKGWQTTRLGGQALNILGEPIEDPSVVPAFVQREEYERRYGAGHIV